MNFTYHNTKKSCILKGALRGYPCAPFLYIEGAQGLCCYSNLPHAAS